MQNPSVYMAKNGDTVYLEKSLYGYRVNLRDRSGDLLDKVYCDTYRAALEYRRAFIAIAKNSA